MEYKDNEVDQGIIHTEGNEKATADVKNERQIEESPNSECKNDSNNSVGNETNAEPCKTSVNEEKVSEDTQTKNTLVSDTKKEELSEAVKPESVQSKSNSILKITSTQSERKTQPSLSDDTVMGHTATLWKYFKTPENEPDLHEEYDFRTLATNNATVIGARVRGKKHKHEGTNCDDWFEFCNVNECTVIAVSDGAGSKKFSRVGAEVSCKAAVQYISEKLSALIEINKEVLSSISKPLNDPLFSQACGLLAPIIQNSVIVAYEAVEKAFADRQTDKRYSDLLGRDLAFKDLSGTFLVSIAIPTVINGKKECLIISCQIGDGMIVAINSKAPFTTASKLVGDADSGAYAGETDFLTSPQMKNIANLMGRTRISRCPADVIMLMSDGVADDYFPNDSEMKRLYLDLIVNGIIPFDGIPDDKVTKSTMAMIKMIPNPVAYPWVNDPSIIIALQYVKRICESTGMSLQDVWEHREILYYASLEVCGVNSTDNVSERLKIWLDNYVERGSFDDRTLVIARI